MSRLRLLSIALGQRQQVLRPDYYLQLLSERFYLSMSGTYSFANSHQLCCSSMFVSCAAIRTRLAACSDAALGQ